MDADRSGHAFQKQTTPFPDPFSTSGAWQPPAFPGPLLLILGCRVGPVKKRFPCKPIAPPSPCRKTYSSPLTSAPAAAA